jgi:hypothetical protein
MEISFLVEFESRLVLETSVHNIGTCLFRMPYYVIDDQAGLKPQFPDQLVL